MTDSLNAEAFTRDGQIYLAGDAPLDSTRGQELLAHELTHVMQQGSRSGSMPGEHTHEGKNLEEAALAVERAMATGQHETRAPVVQPNRPDPADPELHHRPATPVSMSSSTATSSQGSSSWNRPSGASSSAPVPAPVAYSVDTAAQRRERDLGSSSLAGGLGRSAIGAVTDSLLSSFEQELSGPPSAKKDKDSKAKQLERQAAQLYPYIRSRLRAELIREMERRGRISPDWR